MTIYTSAELKRHMGHEIVVGLYCENSLDEEATIECETCYEILYSQFKFCPKCHKKMNKFGNCSDRCDEK